MDRKKVVIIVAIAILIIGIVIAISNSKPNESPADIVASTTPPPEETVTLSEQESGEVIDITKEKIDETIDFLYSILESVYCTFDFI